MSEERGFKQNFIRSFIIGAVISFVAYMIITRVNWGLLGLELGGGPKPDAAIEEAARAAAVTETIRVGGKTWMKRNLNVWTRNSWCYDDNQDNCAEYGRLYTWYAANKACASLGDGWRLPAAYDWDALIDAVGGGSVAHTTLRAPTGWSPDYSVGTDDFGFSALSCGRRFCQNSYRSKGSRVNCFFGSKGDAVWWTATGDGFDAYHVHIGLYYNHEYHGYKEKIEIKRYTRIGGCSVRCVKD